MRLEAVLTFIALIFSANVSMGVVDMRLANYSDTWTDLEMPGSGYNLEVKRTYNSRSLYNGMFGFGWCSDFETSFEVQADGTIKLKECGDGKTVTFVPKSFSRTATKDLINKIVAKVKAENPNYQKKFLDALSKRLEESSSQRQEYARKYGISTGSTSSVYYNQGQSSELLTKKGTYFERRLLDGSSQRFDSKGRLTHMYDKNRNYLKFTYKGDRLSKITDTTGKQLVFKYHANGKVKTITGPGRLKVEYEFSKLSDLSKVKTAFGNTYTYEYDELHNLVKVNYPDKTFKAIKYNTDKDWVVGFVGRDKCNETYNYSLSKKDPKNHYWVDVLKKCGKETVSKAKFEFWYKDGKSSVGKYLARTKTEIDGYSVDTYFSEKFGRPLKTITNGVTTTFTYYENGLLRTRKSGKELAAFKYDPKLNKVSEVRVGKRITKFKYDERGNLLAAQSTTGQSVRLKYDKRGRIVSLVDQARRVVNITYNDQFGKPAQVERPGLGSIKVTYKANGEIENVDSKEGPQVAVQIASAFNSLLDIISPAGIDLGI